MVDPARRDGRAEPPRDDDRSIAHDVRPASPFDGPAIASVHVAAIRELGSDAYDEEQVDAWAAGVDPEGYPLERGRADVEFVVAERDGEIVGFGCLEPNRHEITAVYVHPEYGREGVGSALIDELEARARERGIEDLSLTASKNAAPFYRSVGYEDVGLTDYETTGGLILKCVRMAKSL